MSANLYFSSCRPNLSQHHANSRAFSRAIVSEQSKNFSALDLQIEVIDSDTFGKNLLNLDQLNHALSRSLNFQQLFNVAVSVKVIHFFSGASRRVKTFFVKKNWDLMWIKIYAEDMQMFRVLPI